MAKRSKPKADAPSDIGMSMSLSNAPSPAAATAAVQQAGAVPTNLTPEQQGHLRSRAAAAAFGEVLGALMRSPKHRTMTLEQIDMQVVPAMATGQFAVANMPVPNRPGETAPVGVIMWASVSKEIDERLSKATAFPLPIQRNEWKSGDIAWIVDCAGPKPVMDKLIEEVTARTLGGKKPKHPAGAI